MKKFYPCPCCQFQVIVELHADEKEYLKAVIELKTHMKEHSKEELIDELFKMYMLYVGS